MSANSDVQQSIDTGAAGKGKPRSIQFSPDGRHIAVATTKGVGVYDTQTLVEEWFLLEQQVNALTYSPDGSTVATIFEDGSVRVINARDGMLVKALVGLVGTAYSNGRVAFSHDGSLLASGGDYGAVRVWRANNWDPLFIFAEQHSGIVCLLFSQDDTILVTANGSEIPVDVGTPHYTALCFWSMADGSLIRTIAPKRYLNPLGLADDGQLLILTRYERSLNTWVLEAWKVEQTDLTLLRTIDKGMSGGTVNVRAGGIFSQDERLFAIGTGTNPHAGIWQIDNPQKQLHFTGQGKYALGVAISPDSKTFAVASENGTVQLWAIDPDAFS